MLKPPVAQPACHPEPLAPQPVLSIQAMCLPEQGNTGKHAQELKFEQALHVLMRHTLHYQPNNPPLTTA